ncbi:MAG: hypothetical protein CBB70_04235 [Planctomycetaceae bacterium TMED10]|nr:MAG: hypothetical protein CBB70_04235 [Planctomycetaceae bacterium TMED10]
MVPSVAESNVLEADQMQLRKFRNYYPNLPVKLAKSKDYFSKMRQIKLNMVRENYTGGTILDLCCGEGMFLKEVSVFADRLIGVDFSGEMLALARTGIEMESRHRVQCVQANARHTPLLSDSIHLAYCYSSLCAIPRVEDVLAECSRVLVPGGIAILDFGLQASLNTHVVKAYEEIADGYHRSRADIQAMLKHANLKSLSSRSFQMLPLWGHKPRWLRPLLHPIWKKVMSLELRGKMLDEWISSAPLLNAFAFRRIEVCRKMDVVLPLQKSVYQSAGQENE